MTFLKYYTRLVRRIIHVFYSVVLLRSIILLRRDHQTPRLAFYRVYTEIVVRVILCRASPPALTRAKTRVVHYVLHIIYIRVYDIHAFLFVVVIE